MCSTRRSFKSRPVVDSSDSEDDVPLKKRRPTPKKTVEKSESATKTNGSSSSESDIENYLQPVNKIDFSSSFFTSRQKNENEFEKIEKNMFSGVKRLTYSSDSDFEDKKKPLWQTIPSLKIETELPKDFRQYQEYNLKIEEAKQQIEIYNAKKKAKEATTDISNLLAQGELKQMTLDDVKEEDLHSSDFESTDDEWEEVKVKDQQEGQKTSDMPKMNLEITVGAMPEHCKKKSGADLLAAMKRRLNRIRKVNQVFVHKVHLMCWIAHGNYVNSAVNSSQVLGSSLSLLPSDKCPPPDGADLNHIKQIMQWYSKTMKIIEKPSPKELVLRNSLLLQINRKQAFNKKMYVFIFTSLLRALGMQCRLVFSVQVEPLRPPESDLHSLAKKTNEKPVKEGTSSTSAQKKETDKSVINTKPRISKSKSTKDDKELTVRGGGKTKALIGGSTAKDEDKLVINTKPRIIKSKSTKDGKEVTVKGGGKNKALIGELTAKDAEQSHKPAIKRIVNKENVIENSRNTRSKSSLDKEGTSKTILRNNKENNNYLSVPDQNKKRSKSNSSASAETSPLATKTRSKSSSDVIKVKLPPKAKTRSKKTCGNVPQLDGLNDSSDDMGDISQVDGATDEKGAKKTTKSQKPNLKKIKTPAKKSCPVKRHSNRLKIANYDTNSEDEFVPSLEKTLSSSKKPKPEAPASKERILKSLVVNLTKCKKTANKRKSKYGDSDYDSDYMPDPAKKVHQDADGSDLEYFVSKTKKRVVVRGKKAGEKTISGDKTTNKDKKKEVNVWIEVYLEVEEKWIAVDVVRGQVNCVNDLYSKASQPITYIIAWNNDSTLKDVTPRYCKSFNTLTRKLRVDANWWKETLEPFVGKKTATDIDEDEDLSRQQLEQPLPKVISEYKNHPLYILRRHLLKYEVVYPSDAVPLGYVRGEPVYPRSCLYTCKSRKIWLKDGKVVKPGEEPYKIVTAPPRWDKINRKIITGGVLDVYGEWQTMDFVPPPVENGVIPRNEYGNVELFKPNMLPKGGVHLKLPGLNKVCRKLNIDCASVVTGFEFLKGWNRPVYDGFVVCEEFEDQVVAAWEVEQDNIEKRENEKIEKRVYDNWRKLIKGLWIRERLKAKYNFCGVTATISEKEKKKIKGPKFVTKKRRV